MSFNLSGTLTLKGQLITKEIEAGTNNKNLIFYT